MKKSFPSTGVGTSGPSHVMDDPKTQMSRLLNGPVNLKEAKHPEKMISHLIIQDM
jgi:hypothetical protein